MPPCEPQEGSRKAVWRAGEPESSSSGGTIPSGAAKLEWERAPASGAAGELRPAGGSPAVVEGLREPLRLAQPERAVHCRRDPALRAPQRRAWGRAPSRPRPAGGARCRSVRGLGGETSACSSAKTAGVNMIGGPYRKAGACGSARVAEVVAPKEGESEGGADAPRREGGGTDRSAGSETSSETRNTRPGAGNTSDPATCAEGAAAALAVPPSMQRGDSGRVGDAERTGVASRRGWSFLRLSAAGCSACGQPSPAGLVSLACCLAARRLCTFVVRWASSRSQRNQMPQRGHWKGTSSSRGGMACSRPREAAVGSEPPQGAASSARARSDGAARCSAEGEVCRAPDAPIVGRARSSDSWRWPTARGDAPRIRGVATAGGGGAACALGVGRLPLECAAGRPYSTAAGGCCIGGSGRGSGRWPERFRKRLAKGKVKANPSAVVQRATRPDGGGEGEAQARRGTLWWAMARIVAQAGGMQRQMGARQLRGEMMDTRELTRTNQAKAGGREGAAAAPRGQRRRQPSGAEKGAPRRQRREDAAAEAADSQQAESGVRCERQRSSVQDSPLGETPESSAAAPEAAAVHCASMNLLTALSGVAQLKIEASIF